jgi:hypothetical protein
MSTPLDVASKYSRWLAAFSCGQFPGGVVRLTTWPSDVSYGGNTFSSEAEMEIAVPPNTGALNERPIEVTLSEDSLEIGFVQAPVTLLLLQQVVPDTDDPTLSGEVSTVWTWAKAAVLGRITKNPRGRNGLQKLEFLSPKGRLRSDLGISSSAQCAWTLFDAQCQAVWVPETATLSAIDADDPQRVTIADFNAAPVAPGGTAGRFYQDGHIMRDGLAIEIRDWDPAIPSIFHLRRRPPTSWVGVAEGITLYPGCSKVPDVCGGRWGRLGTIGCFGIKTPNKNPVFGV